MSLNNQALQLQMAGSLSSQTNLFTQMNTLLKTMSNVLTQLNTGFKALTQAILRNTTTMAQLAQKGGPNAVLNTLTGKGRTPSTNTLENINAIGNAMDVLNRPIIDIIGSINTSAIPALQNYNTAIKQSANALSPIKNSWGDIWSTLVYPLKAAKNAAQTRGLERFNEAKSLGLDTKRAGREQALGTLFGGVGTFVKTAVTAPFQAASKMISPFTSALGSMGPQMAMLAIVTEPVTALLSAFLEPLSMLTDYFSGFGSVLSQLLIPIMMAIQPLLDALMTILMQVVPMLVPFITQLFSLTGIGALTQILIPLMPLIGAIVSLFAALLQAISPLLGIVASLIPMLMTSLMPAITVISETIMNLVNWIVTNIAVVEKAAKDAINAITGWWTDTTTTVNNWGKDNGWW